MKNEPALALGGVDTAVEDDADFVRSFVRSFRERTSKVRQVTNKIRHNMTMKLKNVSILVVIVLNALV